MENLLQFIDLMRYFGDLDTAVNFCQYLSKTPYSNLEGAINACSTVWNTTYKN